MKAVGARLPRYDGLGHVTARRTYVDDVRVPRHALGEGAPLAAPHAAIRELDTRKARGASRACTRSSRTRTSRRTSTATSRRSAFRPTSRCSPSDEVRYKGQPIAVVAADDEDDGAARRVDADRGRVRGARAALRHPQGVRSRRRRRSTRGAPVYPHFGPHRPPPRSARATSTRRSTRPTRSSRASTGPQAIEHCPLEPQVALAVPEAERPADDLLLHAGDVLLDGRRRRAPRSVPLNRLKFVGGTVGGGFGGKVDTATRDDLRAARAQGRAAGQVALDARGGVPRLVDARALAHRDRGRGHERRLDPRPQDADAPRRRRLHALLAVRADEARVPPHGRVHDPEHHFNGYVVFTNRVPTTAMRGFGVTSVSFAVETAHEPDRRRARASTRSSCG